VRYALFAEAGRGSVTLVEQPSGANGEAVIVELEDEEPGAARYRWFLVAHPRPPE
jgi:hypothetical protein